MNGLLGSVGCAPAPNPTAIAGAVLFRGLPHEALVDVAQAGRICRVAKGTILFGQGSAVDRLFVLLEGRIKACQATPDGQQVIARFLNAGDPFGCVTLMEVATYPVTTITEVDSVVAKWTAPEMMEFANRYPQIAINALRFVGAQLRDVQARLQEAVTERVEQRIAHALLRLIRQSGRKTAQGIEINFPITRQDIAEISASRVFTVSRTLSRWEDLGVVKNGRRHLVVVAPHRLLMLAEKA